MSEQQRDIDEIDLDGEITPEIAAILEFTSNINHSDPGDITFITSKDAYIWAGLAVFLARYATPSYPISDIEVKAEIYRIISEMSASLNLYNRGVPWVAPLTSKGSDEADIRSLLPYKTQFFETDTSNQIIRLLIYRFSPHFQDDFEVANVINTATVDGYKGCISRRLISDPIIETSLTLAILGLTPFSIVRKTKKGSTTYFKIRSALWKYEKEKQTNVITTYNLTFEVARIARIIKIGLIAAYHDATKGEGDEPEP